MLNKVLLQGRLTADPELKQTTSGIDVCAFSLAVERNIKSADGNRHADFLNCVAWRNTAKFLCEYFSKGKMCVIVGELQSRPYEDKNGNKRTAFEVVVSEVNFCGGDNKPAEGQEDITRTAAPAQNDISAIEFVEVDADTLPF